MENGDHMRKMCEVAKQLAERARRRCVDAFRSNRPYRARAARNWDSWKTFYVWHVNWSEEGNGP